MALNQEANRGVEAVLQTLEQVAAECKLEVRRVAVERAGNANASGAVQLHLPGSAPPVARWEVTFEGQDPSRGRARAFGRSYRLRSWSAPQAKLPADLLGPSHRRLPGVQEVLVDQRLPAWEHTLTDQARKLLLHLSGEFDRPWSSVDEVIRDYRSAFDVADFPLASESLRGRTLLARHHFQHGFIPLETYAVCEGAYARVLQQWGHHAEAQARVEAVAGVVPPGRLSRLLSAETADAILSARLRAVPLRFGEDGCGRIIDEAAGRLRRVGSRARFRWRGNLDRVARGSLAGVEDGIRSYQEMLPGDPVAAANVALQRAWLAVARGRFADALAQAGRYRDALEDVWRHRQDLAYPAMHGALGSVRAEAMLHAFFGPAARRAEFLRFLTRVERVRDRARIYDPADAVWEADRMLDVFAPGWRKRMPARRGVDGALFAPAQGSPGLHDLCGELAELVQDGQ